MYDAIVIGARCAGSPTAMLLSRKGYRVLLVDRATFPSDTFRNHVIRHDGTVRLLRWGLLDRIIAAGTPPIRKWTSDFGDFPLSGYPPPGDGVDAEYGPRRTVLDKILVDAAAEAGAEVREGFSVSGILMDGDRVTGIRGKSKGGSTVTEHARIVVGADGHHSLVARTVGAPPYNEKPALTCGYFSYWSDLPLEGIEVYFRDTPAFMLAFATNFGQTCVAIQLPVNRFPAFRADVEGTFYSALDAAPEFAERVRAGRREERFVGTGDLENFFRKPYGRGWALAGDAGYHKDPITARGVSDAFRDAELLAEAIDEGFSGCMPLEEALAAYQQRRDAAAMPQYEGACAAALLEPIPSGTLRLRAAIRGNQDLIDGFFGVNEGTVNREAFFGSAPLQQALLARDIEDQKAS